MSDVQQRALTVREEDFPRAGSARDRLRFALNYAILAPSSHNSQPWRFVLQDHSVLVCADRTRALPVADPFDRELIISCGAALFNLRVALAHFGQAYRIALFPYQADADVLAEVFLEVSGFRGADIAPLFAAIPLRVTNRTVFEPGPIPAALREAMRKAAEDEGAGLACIEDEALRFSAAELVAEGDRAQFSDYAFRRELAMWIHGSRRHDGMPAYALAGSDLLKQADALASPMMSSVIRTFDIGNGVAASHRQLALGSPALLTLATAMDNAEAWLCAGQALERVLLLAAQAGYSISYLNQPIEVPALRSRLRALAASDTWPQMLLRMGRGRAVPPAPRRPLAEVLA